MRIGNLAGPTGDGDLFPASLAQMAIDKVVGEVISIQNSGIQVCAPYLDSMSSMIAKFPSWQANS